MSADAPPVGDELFELDPEEFVAARDALARRLRGEGDKAAAATVKGLRRPTVAAWALNQLARRHGDEVQALVAEGQELAEAQGRALAGERTGFREAAQRRRDAIRQLTRRADAVLVGRNPAVHRDDVVATLTAASVDPDAASSLLEGRLAAPIAAPTGFEGTGTEPSPEAAATEPARPKGRAGKAEAARERADQKAAEARRAAEEEQGRADEAVATAREAAAAADASDAEVQRLESALDEARRVAGDDARRAREAAARAEAATKRAEAAAERAERAEQAR